MGHTDYKYFVGDIKIPVFADIIFSIPNISDREKERFRDGFLLKYLRDYELQQLIEGGFIHVQNGKILGVFESSDRYEIEGEEPYSVIKINYNAKEHSINYVGQKTITIGDNVNDTNPIMIDVDILYNNDKYPTVKYQHDTGCFATYLPFQDKWDFQKGDRYKELSFGAGRYDLNTNDLNRNINKVEFLKCSTAGIGKLFKRGFFQKFSKF